MWVTQTYLGKVEPDAKVFIYYLFEDYNPDQIEFTNAVQFKLEELGTLYESNVSLLMPNPRYAARIETEVRGIQDLWWSLNGKLPGIFVSTTPLSEFDIANGNCYFVSFKETTPKGAAETIQEIRKLINDQLAWEYKNQAIKKEEISIFKKLFDAIELKPNINGFGIDLKKLAQK